MEENYSNEEKIAIANVLYNLVNADYRTRKGEPQCLKECLDVLQFDSDGFVPVSRNELQVRSYETLKHMTKEKKQVFSRMMTQLSRADGHFGPKEQAFVREILDMCEVPFVHK